MKLIIIGSSKPFALESFYLKHIKELGHEVEIFSSSDVFQTYYNRNIFNKLKFRLGISTIYKQINNDLLNFINHNKPDWVLIFKGMEIFPASIVKIKEQGIFTSNYNPDHPFHFHGKGSGNPNVSNGLSKYDLHITYNLNIKEQIEQQTNLPCEWLQFGFEPSEQALPLEREEIKSVCFIGFADQQRVSSIQNIVQAGIEVDVYGPNWDKFLKSSNNLRIFPAVYNDAFNATATKYRVQLNLFRPHNIASHNMRSFEMPGIGCIMLAPDSIEHRMFFESEKEIFTFATEDEMIGQIKKILALPYRDALAIRKNAIERSIESKYTYADRAAQLINILTKYKLRKNDHDIK